MGAENHPKDTVCCKGPNCACGSGFRVKNLEKNGGGRKCPENQCPHQIDITNGKAQIVLAGSIPFAQINQ